LDNLQAIVPDQKLHRIVFQPSGRQGYVPDGITVLDAARQLGVGIEGICGGRQTCDDILATGICGSGIIEAVAEMFLTGIISADGRFGEREHPLIHFNGRKGVYTLTPATQSATGSPIVVTQDDVRAIQLAKAALYAGVTLLLDHHGSRAVERILLAGAFGSYIDPKYAMILGLILDCDLSRVMSVGNAAGDGARIALLNQKQRLEAEDIARHIRYVETATDPGFQDAFVEAIHIPHMKDPFTHLSGILPASAEPKSTRRRVRAE
jgi:uncharacterized 2Fe-2S/4Fe-4S cluster protein (DUF4445 family)